MSVRSLKSRDAIFEKILLLEQKSDIHAKFTGDVHTVFKQRVAAFKNVSISDLRPLSTIS